MDKEKLDYSLPDEVDEQVRGNLPDLLCGKYRSVLYVGANHLRQHFLPEFVKEYERIVVLEIYPDNVKYLKETYKDPKINILTGDVRDIGNMDLGKFDVCFFWHGPEHLSKDEAKPILDVLESMTEQLIVLGMPYGHYDQGSEYGNDHETHLWDIYPKDMEKLGYLTHTLGKADDTLANMMAWKLF